MDKESKQDLSRNNSIKLSYSSFQGFLKNKTSESLLFLLYLSFMRLFADRYTEKLIFEG